jgi:hypothetical protein
MERSKGYTPSKYQLGLDFGQQPFDAQPAESLRFTYEVKEEIKVLSPEIAGAYLLSHVYTPFEAFQQEEVWILLLNTKNRKLKDVIRQYRRKEKPVWVVRMAAIHRKTLIVCRTCHLAIHHGTYDGRKLT